MDLAGEPTALRLPGRVRAEARRTGRSRAKLKAAGAVIVGKTNSPEIGLWPFTEGSAFGATRNPWNLDHTPGGSSGGAAAAVSAGLFPPPSARTAPARCASRPPGPIWSASSRSAAGSPPGPTPEAFNGLTVQRPARAHRRRRRPAARRAQRQRRRRPAPPAAAAGDLRRGRRRDRPAGCASRSRSTSPTAARPPSLDPEVRARRRAHGRRARGPRPRRRDGRRPLRPLARRQLHAPLDGRHPRVGRPRVPTASLLDPRVRESAATAVPSGRCCRSPALAERIGASHGRPDLPPLRRRPRPDHRAAAAADRRLRRAEQLGDGQDDRRRLPLRLALERPRLAGRQRARRLHRVRPADRRPAARPGQQRAAAARRSPRQLEAAERWQAQAAPIDRTRSHA